MKDCTLALIWGLSGMVTATFNLNTSGPDWDYTAKDLANTTSQVCKDAYSADIDCDPTLLGLVASMRPAFKPGVSDFDSTCTTSCKDSLATYIAGVQAACTAPGDKSQESVGGGDNVDMYLDPVEIVGQIFQYTFASDCAKTTNGSYCFFEDTANADSFSCSDECAVEFYTAAHDYPASAKEFNYYWLISRGEWWAEEFATGWTRLQEVCGVADDNSTSTVSSSGNESSVATTTATATATRAASGASNAELTTTEAPRGLSGSASTTAWSSPTLTSTSTSTSSPAASSNAGTSLQGGYVAGSALLSLVLAWL